MRRFEIQSTMDGSASEPLGEGVEFASGAVVVNWARPFSSSIEIFAGGVDALALHTLNADIVWLDKPEMLAAPPEEEAGRHADKAIDLTELQAIEHLTQKAWEGAPLPEALTPPTEGPPIKPTEMWPPKARFIYRVNPGGLKRCCLESLDVYMDNRNKAGRDDDGEDGDIVDCLHCSSSMIRAGGAWKWSQQ